MVPFDKKKLINSENSTDSLTNNTCYRFLYINQKTNQEKQLQWTQVEHGNCILSASV